ncbi:MAG: RidA family protein [Patescibacteria group bacterium]
MQIISTSNAPAAIGPYSQAIKNNGLVFCSGQIALTKDGDFRNESVEIQARQALENLGEVLKAANSDFAKVVKTTIFLADINDFAKVNEIYAEFFGANKPARSTIAVAALPKKAKVEIEAIALVD